MYDHAPRDHLHLPIKSRRVAPMRSRLIHDFGHKELVSGVKILSNSKGLSTGIILITIAVVIIGMAAVLAMFLLDSPQKENSDDTNDFRAKTERSHVERESILPAELTAEMNFKDGSWQANGPVKDENLIRLAKTHKRLPIIYLNQSDITAKGIAALKGHEVVELEIVDSDITPEMTAAISQIDGLKRLFLKDGSVTDLTMKSLTGPKSVEVLHFRHGPFHAESLKDFDKRFPKLQQIVFMDCANIGDDVLEPLSKYKHLDHIGFTDSSISPEGALNVLKTLTPFTFGYRGPRATKFIEGLKGDKVVLQLDMSGATLTDAAIDSLGTLKQLRTLCLQGINGATKERTTRLRKALPSCNIDINTDSDRPEMGIFDTEKEAAAKSAK